MSDKQSKGLNRKSITKEQSGTWGELPRITRLKFAAVAKAATEKFSPSLEGGLGAENVHSTATADLAILIT